MHCETMSLCPLEDVPLPIGSRKGADGCIDDSFVRRMIRNAASIGVSVNDQNRRHSYHKSNDPIRNLRISNTAGLVNCHDELQSHTAAFEAAAHDCFYYCYCYYYHHHHRCRHLASIPSNRVEQVESLKHGHM